MIDRPLFDAPPAPQPKRQRPRHKTPTLPARAKMPPESWTVTFTAAPGTDIPPVCRIRRLLKSAWRGYRLKAKVIAQPTPESTPGNSTHDISSNGQPMWQIGSNAAEN